MGERKNAPTNLNNRMKVSQIAFILIAPLLACLSASASTFKVCTSCAHTSIVKTIEMASAHDTILVDGGHYKEGEIVIEKPLTLLGVNNPIIDGEKKSGCFSVTGDSITLKGFTIQNVGLSYTEDFAAIYLSRVNHFTIENNILKDVFFGMLIEKSHFGTIRHNEVSSNAIVEHSSGNGIHLFHSSDVYVSDNHLTKLRDGIYFEFVTNCKIENNLSEDNLRYGLHFMFSNHNEYYDNVFRNNGAGVAVMFSKFIQMKRNHFYKNWGTASYGLLLKEIYDAEIEDNIFEENTIGINIEGSNRINYKRNNLIRNGWAIKIAGGCYTNVFVDNNFIGNSFDISYNSKMNDNSFNGNYWSEYTGYDLDRDGIGDVPYRPVKLFSYIVNQTPETIILLRSLFIDILNFSEKVSPVFTPDNLVDSTPKMQAIK